RRDRGCEPAHGKPARLPPGCGARARAIGGLSWRRRGDCGESKSGRGAKQGAMKRATVALLLLCAAPALAAAPAPGSIAERYQHARQTLEQARARENATQAERDRLAAEARSIAQRLVTNAERVQALESQLSQSQADLRALSARESALRAELALGRDKVSRLLA